VAGGRSLFEVFENFTVLWSLPVLSGRYPVPRFLRIEALCMRESTSVYAWLSWDHTPSYPPDVKSA